LAVITANGKWLFSDEKSLFPNGKWPTSDRDLSTHNPKRPISDGKRWTSVRNLQTSNRKLPTSNRNPSTSDGNPATSDDNPQTPNGKTLPLDDKTPYAVGGRQTSGGETPSVTAETPFFPRYGDELRNAPVFGA